MQDISFTYDFEISKNNLKKVLFEIENGIRKFGLATEYYIKMGLASLTLLENAFKGVDFNFTPLTLENIDKLFGQLKNTNEKDFDVYCQLIGAYFGWCAVKEYNCYFATYNDTYCLIYNNKAFSPQHLVKFAIENDKSLYDLLNQFD